VGSHIKMADDGGYSVWGAEDDSLNAEQPSHQSIPSISPPKRTSKLFDDLEETTADWDIQSSPPPEKATAASKRLSLLDEGLPAASPDSGIDAIQAPVDQTFEPSQSKANDLFDQLDSAGFDDFQDGHFETAGDDMKDDDFGDFGEFEEDQEGAFDIPVPEASIAGPSRSWVSTQMTDSRVSHKSTDDLLFQRPLSIESNTDAASIESSIREILAPAFADGRMYPFHDGAASQLSQDRIRQVEGEAQVLVREER
jgi:hypothetical protein